MYTLEEMFIYLLAFYGALKILLKVLVWFLLFRDDFKLEAIIKLELKIEELKSELNA